MAFSPTTSMRFALVRSMGDAAAAMKFQAIQAAYDVLRAAEERRTMKP